MSAAVCANCGRAVAFEGGRIVYCGEGCMLGQPAPVEAPSRPEAGASATIPRPDPVPLCEGGHCAELADGEAGEPLCTAHGARVQGWRPYAPAPAEAAERHRLRGAPRADLDPDEVECMRRSVYLLGRLAQDASLRAFRTSSAAVAGREHNLAMELARAARAIERVVGSGEEG